MEEIQRGKIERDGDRVGGEMGRDREGGREGERGRERDRGVTMREREGKEERKREKAREVRGRERAREGDTGRGSTTGERENIVNSRRYCSSLLQPVMSRLLVGGALACFYVASLLDPLR